SGVVATDCNGSTPLSITQTPTAGTLVGLGGTTVTLHVKDGASNESTCTATLTVTDNTPPTITTCAPDQSAFANGVCQAPVPDFTSGIVATDCNGSTPLSITQTPTAGTLVGLGVTTVTLHVKDGETNESTCTATFTVTDNTPPTITTCAPNQSAFANGVCQAPVPDFTSGVVATDCNGSTPLSITQTPNAGTLVGLGVTTVTLHVKDGAGNESTCTATFTVTDNTPPTITTCAPDQSAFANGVCQAPVPDFTSGVVATDCNGSTPLSITQTPTAGTLVGLGVTTVTLHVKDGASNESTCTATLTVTDNTPPTITTCAPNQSAFANGLCQAPVPDFTSGVVATDCNGSTPLSITQTPAAGTLVGLGTTTVTLHVKDGATNESTCTATFTVTDNTPPTLNCSPVPSASADGSCQAAVPNVLSGVTVSDGCTP